MSSTKACIVVFPYSSNIIRDDRGNPSPKLSVLSRISLEAASELQKLHPTAKLVVPGETCYGSEYASTGDLMEQEAPLRTQEVVILKNLPDGRYLNNTYLQTAAIADFLNRQSLSVMVVALAYHMPRVQGALAAEGLLAEFHIAETLLSPAGMTKFEPYLEQIHSLKLSEIGLRLLQKIDKKGSIPNWLTGKFGARVVDVVAGKSGIHLENTRATKKLHKLLKQQ